LTILPEVFILLDTFFYIFPFSFINRINQNLNSCLLLTSKKSCAIKFLLVIITLLVLMHIIIVILFYYHNYFKFDSLITSTNITIRFLLVCIKKNFCLYFWSSITEFHGRFFHSLALRPIIFVYNIICLYFPLRIPFLQASCSINRFLEIILFLYY